MTKDIIQKRLKSQLKILPNTILDCSIRVGKTKIALDMLNENESVLWVYPRKFMLQGYKEDLLKFPPKTSNIIFTTTSSLKKHTNESFDTLIVDEPQDLSDKQIKHLKTIKFKRRLGLSGSLSIKTKRTLMNELGWVAHIKYSLSDAIRDGLVKNYKIFVHLVDMDDSTKNIVFKKFGRQVKGTEKEAYESLSETVDYFDTKMTECLNNGDIAGSKKSHLGKMKYVNLRTSLIYNSATLFNYAKNLIEFILPKKTLVYTLRTNIADALGTTSFHTKNRDEEMLKWYQNSTEGCLGTVNCISTGITIKNLNNVVFHSFESNTETFSQKLGRSLYYDDNESNTSYIHVCVLKGTQSEKWIDKACEIIDRKKIEYTYKGLSYSFIDWLNFTNPGKRIFKIAGSNQYVIETKLNSGEYYYPSNPDKPYSFSQSKLEIVK